MSNPDHRRCREPNFAVLSIWSVRNKHSDSLVYISRALNPTPTLRRTDRDRRPFKRFFTWVVLAVEDGEFHRRLPTEWTIEPLGTREKVRKYRFEQMQLEPLQPTSRLEA